MKIIKSSAIILGVTIVLYVLTDAVFGLVFPVKPYASNPERLTAAAYRNEPYFSEAFLAESFTQPGRWTTLPGTDLVLPAEFHGKYFNVDILPPTGLAYRRTINPAAAQGAERTVLVLGASGIYASEVPDGLTLPSQLSTLLNHAKGGRFKVVNAGVSSSNSRQDLGRLQYEINAGLRPDVVIYYAGVNEINQGVYFGAPQSVMFSDAKRNRAVEWAKRLLPRNIQRWVSSQAALHTQKIAPAHLADAATVTRLAQETAALYEKHVLAMQEIARRNKFRLIVILQPYAFSTPYATPTEDVEQAAKVADVQMPKGRSVLDEGYGQLRLSIGRLRANGVDANDLSAVFRNKSENIFLDGAHVNSIGNQLLASQLSRIVLAGDAGARR